MDGAYTDTGFRRYFRDLTDAVPREYSAEKAIRLNEIFSDTRDHVQQFVRPNKNGNRDKRG